MLAANVYINFSITSAIQSSFTFMYWFLPSLQRIIENWEVWFTLATHDSYNPKPLGCHHCPYLYSTKRDFLSPNLLRHQQKAAAFPNKPMLHGCNFRLRDSLAMRSVCNIYIALEYVNIPGLPEVPHRT